MSTDISAQIKYQQSDIEYVLVKMDKERYNMLTRLPECYEYAITNDIAKKFGCIVSIGQTKYTVSKLEYDWKLFANPELINESQYAHNILPYLPFPLDNITYTELRIQAKPKLNQETTIDDIKSPIPFLTIGCIKNSGVGNITVKTPHCTYETRDGQIYMSKS